MVGPYLWGQRGAKRGQRGGARHPAHGGGLGEGWDAMGRRAVAAPQCDLIKKGCGRVVRWTRVSERRRAVWVGCSVKFIWDDVGIFVWDNERKRLFSG